MLFPPTLSNSGLHSISSDLCELIVCYNRWNIWGLRLGIGEVFLQRRFAFAFASNEGVQPIWDHVGDLAPPLVRSLLSFEGFSVWWGPRLPFRPLSLAQSSVSWHHYCNQCSPSDRSALTSLSFLLASYLFALVRLIMSQIMYPNQALLSCSRSPLEHTVRHSQKRKKFALSPFPCCSHLWHYTHRALPTDIQALVPAQGRKNVSASALPSGVAWHWVILLHRNEYLMWSGWVRMLGHLWGIAFWIPQFDSGPQIGLLLWTLLPFLKSICYPA